MPVKKLGSVCHVGAEDETEETALTRVRKFLNYFDAHNKCQGEDFLVESSPSNIPFYLFTLNFELVARLQRTVPPRTADKSGCH